MKWRIVNMEDANVQFSVEADDLSMASNRALEELGWAVLKPARKKWFKVGPKAAVYTAETDPVIRLAHMDDDLYG